MTTGESRPPCDLFRPGHLVHWIQARKASEPPASWGVLTEVDDQWITVTFLDRVVRYRNHDAVSILDFADLGAKVRVSERYHVLGVQLANYEHKIYCIAMETDEWTPCSFDPLVDTSPEGLAERLRTRGGFSVPGEAVFAGSLQLDLVDDEDEDDE